MFFANDNNDNRVHISNTHSNQEYYCPYCGAPLIVRKGEIRTHHFAHKQNHICSDSWEREHSYDTSAWHNDWQACFPDENQEIKLELGDTKHRADVMVDRSVIEFQHSIMPVKAFDDRNNFYFNLGYKVIWLFDLSDQLADNRLSYTQSSTGLVFDWINPKKAFNNYDVQSGCIDLFFQLGEEAERCIVRVVGVSENGFEKFYTTDFMSKEEFLTYVGLKNGECLPPYRDDIENNQKYREFKEKYNITLNKQQERALLAVEGANLLLAVPGSGKTTVLVNRLGHMVFNKNISPESILAITYNKSAAEEMEDRFSSVFGESIGKRIDFRTINSLSLEIYTDFCKSNEKKVREHIDEKKRRLVLAEIYKEAYDDVAGEHEIIELETAITYIKNMMLTDEQIKEIETEYPHLRAMYESYKKRLDDDQLMDFDDQMKYAREILMKRPNVAETWRARYKYICVDEAQDTSKIQHEIIKILAQGNNLFMVGDEDQSIYGFRAAYPKALLNFRYDYLNPYILRMERNYRSTPQIVDKALTFISQNKGRYEKHMTAERGDGDPVTLEQVDSREMQYMRLLEIAKSADRETAFLYRDNESAVALVDLLFRSNVEFNLKKPVANFFETRVVKDVVAFLSLAINPYDTESFKRILNKGVLYLKKQQRDAAIRDCKYNGTMVYDALDKQMPYLKREYRDRADNFRNIMRRVYASSTVDAINEILDSGYADYLEEEHLGTNKVETLLILAKQENNIRSFVERLNFLNKEVNKQISSNDSKIILSTIHTSKGKEYNSVYMVDVYDNIFPSSRPNVFCRSKDNADGEQEERRLFYVGITRAKNNLTLFEIKDKDSSFVNELFREEKEIQRQKEQEIQREMELERQRKVYEEIERRKRAAEETVNKRMEKIREAQERDKTTDQVKTYSTKYAQPKVGMKLLHCDYGELTIIDVEDHSEGTIIQVIDSNGEKSKKMWNILWMCNKIRILV